MEEFNKNVSLPSHAYAHSKEREKGKFMLGSNRLILEN